MRLWHKDLITSNVLPRQQLLSQWRECCCIARAIAVDGTPNHILVNKIMDYPLSHFYTYSMIVCDEMKRRGYKVNAKAFNKFIEHLDMSSNDYTNKVEYDDLFKEWHNDRYLQQCLFNLEEKRHCNGITSEEWYQIINVDRFRKLLGK